MALCRSCKASIRWVTMQGSGKVAPIDETPDPLKGTIAIIAGGDDGHPPTARVITDEERTSGARLYVSHFATCKFADQHRAPKLPGVR